jgi:dienelactone hydrolase
MRGNFWGFENRLSLTNLRKAAAILTALFIGDGAGCDLARSEPAATVVEIESPIASPLPLQGYLRQTDNVGPSPAVVLLHSCNGNWRRLDERWGNRIASWGYVTLAVDSFGPRGITNTCNGGAPVDLAFDAYRALNFLVRQPFVDPARVAALGFSQGGWLVLTSVERGSVEQTSKNKFRAAIAFYPPCRNFNGNVTVPTLILIGELDDWTPAEACRNMVDGRDDLGISRQKNEGKSVQLVVYPDAYHAFDVPSLKTPKQFFGHRLEFNKVAADRSVVALREFLDTTIGEKEQAR